MEKSIINKIVEKYEEFSKTNKVIADYITKNYLTVSFISIKELSEKINVSPASITRFAKELGLNGYPELQQKLQVLVKNEVMPMKEIRDSISIMDKEYNILESIFNANIESLKVSLTENLIESFSKAVNAVMEARKVYILGLRSSFSPAYYLYFMLKQFMDNVILLNTSSWDIYDHLADADKNDLLITIGYSRYTALTVEVAKYCKNRSIKVIGITDNISSPIAVNSDITLIAKNVSNAFSFVSAMTVCNALVVACGAKNKDYSLEKMKKKEAILLENKVYE
ncbi:MurR/RpiR family transcriptional regulator [Thermovenabulum sp.]|uniref:MurR/RpiR family transcriptional regulator n=1 Tax=Thermovenabulum sp. TaxID=3100335 RepID=UPI003C7D256D